MSDSHTLVVSPTTALALSATAASAKAYAAAARSDNTRRAYATQQAGYCSWCAAHGAPELAQESVALYLTARSDAGASIATCAQALAAVCALFARAGEPSPRTAALVREVWQGIRRVRGVAQQQATPVTPEQLRRMVRASKGLAGARDRALLLLGFAAALRRSELVALDVADIRDDADGLVITIRRSKTDQEGTGRTVGVPFGSDKLTCPARALREWLTAAGITEGAVFRGVRRGDRLTLNRIDGRDVARIIQRAAKRARVPVEHLSGHSLRAGLATAAAKAGKPAHVIAKQTGHKSLAMVARYIRDASLFDDNAAAGIGL